MQNAKSLCVGVALRANLHFAVVNFQFALPALLLGAALSLASADTNSAPALPRIALPEALDACLKQNRDLRLMEMALQGRRVDLEASQAAFKWSVRPDGSAEAADYGGKLGYGLAAVQTLDWGTKAEVGGRMTSESPDGAEPFRRGAVRVQVEQPLLRRTGPLVNREPVAKAESAVAAARREIELRRADLIVRLVELYEDLYGLQREAEYERLTLERLNRLILLMQARERQGRATRADCLRVELQAGNAQVRWNGTIERLRSRRADFAETIGAEPQSEYAVLPAARMEVAVTDVDQAARVALRNRLDYAQILQDYEDAARGRRIARRNLLPDLNMIARYERAGEGASSGDALRWDENVWFVGLGLSTDWPPRDRELAVEQAELAAQTAGLKLDALRAAIGRQVRQSWLASERARGEIPQAEKNYRVALSRTQLARRLFEGGRGDSFTVSEAEDQLRDAESHLVTAEGAASVAAYRLLRVMGRLIESPADLKPRAE
jgi:outer membrane protein TolC